MQITKKVAKMGKNAAIQNRKTDAIARGVGMMTQVYAERAENAEIWDVEGNRYIDFAAGIAVVNTGHRHPKVIEAVKAQLDRFTHTCHQVVPYENYVHLAERLNKLVPGDFEKKTLLEMPNATFSTKNVKYAVTIQGPLSKPIPALAGHTLQVVPVART